VFEPRVLKYIEPNKYFDFPDLILKLLANKEKVAGYQFDGYWQDLGRTDDYERAADDFETMRVQFLGEECDR
jgi:NDP-sugar pyrophosphorylase family protein